MRGKISLAHYKSELIAKGEKLSPNDFAARVAESENGVPQLLQGVRQLKKGAALPDHYPPRMQVTHSGRALVGFREHDWIEDKVTNHWEQLAADLKTNEQTLIEIRAALAKPVLNSQLDYLLGMKIPVTNLTSAKALTQWFGAASQLALHEGRNHAALEFLLPHIRLPRLLQEDHIAISELVRDAVAAIAKTATWEALQADGWTDEDLTRMQEAWTTQDFCESMTHGLEGEVVFGDTSFELLRKSNGETVHAFYWMEEYAPVEDSDRPFWERTLRAIPYGDVTANFLKQQIYCRIWCFAWLDQDEVFYVERTHLLLQINRTATAGKSFAETRPAIDRFEAESLNRNLYDRLRYPNPQSLISLSKVVNKAMRAETERSLAICAIALKRYGLRHRESPASLAALVPEFVPSVPIDYMDGKPMKYHLNPDGSFTLYSVGEDVKDDGGDASPLPGNESSRVLWHRKDFVWPSPALPEEVEAWRKEAAKN